MSHEAPAAPIWFGNILAAELTKIRTLPTTWTAMVAASVANGVTGLLAKTDMIRFSGANGPVPIGEIGTLMLAPAYIFLIIAASAGGGEYRGGQLRFSFAATPIRNRLFAAKCLAVAIVCLFAAIVVILPTLFIRHGLDLAHLKVAIQVGETVATYVLLGFIGFGLAIVLKSDTVAAALLFIIPVLVSPLLLKTLPDLVKILPHEAALGMLGLASGPEPFLGRSAGLVLISWAVLSTGVAWAGFTKRDS